jgi:sugar phosphate isomerase/epimerase
MTLDIGHLFCMSEVPIVDYIGRWQERLVNIHIEDMKAGVHEHLMFGEGHIRFPPIIRALAKIGYDRGLHVELSRHSYDAAEIARRSFEFLDPLIREMRDMID